MIEVLYSPEHNELYVFTGCYEYNAETNTMILYLMTNRKKCVTIQAKDLVHVGWL